MTNFAVFILETLNTLCFGFARCFLHVILLLPLFMGPDVAIADPFFIDGLRGRFHSLMGDLTFYFPLFGFVLMALAGIGGGIGFDEFNQDRKRRFFGRLLLFVAAPSGLFILLLSLPYSH